MNNLESPPKTIEEVGIHLFYMAKAMQDLDQTVKDSSNNYATKATTDDHEKRLKKLEVKNIVKDTLLWIGLVASALINVIFVYNLFSGGK